jgi:WD40 repeat protein
MDSCEDGRGTAATQEERTSRWPLTAATDYDAFISYSHAVDGRLAPALQSALQRFAKPWNRIRALRVFRDDASLSANPALWASIEQALMRARWFILLASPRSATSEWVRREVDWWLEHKGPDKLLIVLTEGELEWDAGRLSDSAALPERLRAELTDEPRFIDLRWARARDQLSLRDPRFREAVADLAAPVHERPKEEMIGEEVRQHRRTVRLARGGVATLAVLALLAAIAAVLAIRGQSEARSERDRAERQARLATARQLASQAGGALREDDLDVALLLAAQSFRMQPTSEGRDALLESFARVPRVQTMLHAPPATQRAISGDGRTVALLTDEDRLEVRGLPNRGGTGRRFSVRPDVFGLALSPEGDVVATGNARGEVAIFDVAGEAPARRFPGPAQPPGEEGPFQGTSIAVAPGGRLVAWNGAKISVWNGRERLTMRPGVKPYQWLLAFGDEGRLLAAGSDADGTLVVWRLDETGDSRGSPAVLEAGSGEAPTGWGPAIASLAFSPTDPELIAVGGFDSTVNFWDWNSGRLLARRRAGRGGVRELTFSPDGRRLASTDEAGVRIWDVHRRSLIQSLPRYSAEYTLAFGEDATRLTGVGPDGRIALWDLEDDPFPLARTLRGRDADVQSLAYAPRGGLLATVTYDGAVVWNASTLRPVRSLEAENALDVNFSPDGNTLATWPAALGGLTLWTADGTKDSDADIGSVSDVEFTDAGRPIAATKRGGGSEIWDVRSRRRLRSLASSGPDAGPVELSPDTRVAAGSVQTGEVLRLWEARTGRVLKQSLSGGAPAAITFTADGRTLANSSWDDSTIWLRDAATGRNTARLAGGANADALAFDPAGRRLAAATYSFTAAGESRGIQIWDVARRERLGSQPLATGSGEGFENVPVLEFSPDGRTLAAIGLESRPLFFNVHEPSWPTVACRIAGRNLSRAEWRRYVGTGFDYEPTCSD